MTPEEQYRKDAEAAGLDMETILADQTDVTKPKDKLDNEESKEEDKSEEADKEEAEKDDKEPDDKDTLKEETPKVPRKRSVYDDLKSEKQKRKEAEAEVERLKNNPPQKTEEEARQDEQDDLEAYAKENNLDPVALKKMRELFIKDVKPQTDESIAKDLAEFKAWKATNDTVLEKNLFESEFASVVPTIKEYFPNISDAEMLSVKAEVDKISHSKEWHDKDLDYILFKNKETFGKLITPHKRSLESKGRKDVERSDTDFNTTPDFANMTSTELNAWEAQYRSASRTGVISTDSQGRKVIL